MGAPHASAKMSPSSPKICSQVDRGRQTGPLWVAGVGRVGDLLVGVGSVNLLPADEILEEGFDVVAY
ncbi:hypothetical protein [Streptomyces gardneri]|uniref:hypothetical protein n=1 Tax=Streptomyces gardneri TaxID=66892 RepID=UPI0037D6E2DB